MLVLTQVCDPIDIDNILVQRTCFLGKNGELLDLGGLIGVRFADLIYISEIL